MSYELFVGLPIDTWAEVGLIDTESHSWPIEGKWDGDTLEIRNPTEVITHVVGRDVLEDTLRQAMNRRAVEFCDAVKPEAFVTDIEDGDREMSYELFVGPEVDYWKPVALIDIETQIPVVSGQWNGQTLTIDKSSSITHGVFSLERVESNLREHLNEIKTIVNAEDFAENGGIAWVKPDMVNSPPHYQLLPGVEVYDVRMALLEKMEDVPPGQVDDWSRAWEYLTRMWQKNGLEDAKKCRWYLDKLIEKMSDKQK